MKGVEPSGPRPLRSLGSSAADFMNPGRSAERNASTMATALGFSGGISASLASESGHLAPWAVHVFIATIFSGGEGPAAGDRHSPIGGEKGSYYRYCRRPPCAD